MCCHMFVWAKDAASNDYWRLCLRMFSGNFCPDCSASARAAVRLQTGDERSSGVEPMEHEPGASAPLSGVYREVNIFGTPTGRRVQVQEGEPLPSAPVGFSWVLVAS